MNLAPGQLWIDVDKIYSDSMAKVIFLLLSADYEGELYVWSAAQFHYHSPGFSGAFVRKFTEEEIRKMSYAGLMLTHLPSEIR